MNRFVVLIVIIVAAASLWTGGWFVVASMVETEIAAYETADGVTELRLECDDLDVGGFPFQFHPRCIGARITSGDIAVELPRIDATALFYRPTHIQVFAQGPARISDSFLGTVQEVSWQTLRASVRLDGDALERLSIVASQLAYADALMGTTVLATAGETEFHLIGAPAAETPTAGDTFDLYFSAEDADIPALDLASAALVIDGRVTGLAPLGDMFGPQGAALWQANGGAVALRMLDAQAEGLELTATGEVALDDTGRANGTIEVTSGGVVDRLTAYVQPELAELFLGSPGEDGRSAQTITLDAGTVQVGIIPVQTIPPLF